jgi:hypothetical protein
MEGQQPAMQVPTGNRRSAWVIVLIIAVAAAAIVWYAFAAMQRADEGVMMEEDAMDAMMEKDAMMESDAEAEAAAAEVFVETETNPFDEAETNPFEDADYNPFQ